MLEPYVVDTVYTCNIQTSVYPCNPCTNTRSKRSDSQSSKDLTPDPNKKKRKGQPRTNDSGITNGVNLREIDWKREKYKITLELESLKHVTFSDPDSEQEGETWLSLPSHRSGFQNCSHHDSNTNARTREQRVVLLSIGSSTCASFLKFGKSAHTCAYAYKMIRD